MSVLAINVNEEIHTRDGLVSDVTHYRGLDHALYSVDPPTTYLTFGYWIHLVPPFKPRDVLMLGYSGGTVAGLIQLLYGADIPITGVDTEIVDNRHNVELVKADARAFVKICKAYDCVIVDLFVGRKTPEFVYEDEFIEQLVRITKRMLLLYVQGGTPLSPFEARFKSIRALDTGNMIYYLVPMGSTANYLPPL